MAYSTQTWIDGNATYPLSAARLSHMESGIAAAQSVPCCRVTNTGTQTIASGVQVVLSFDTEAFDTDTMHDPATNPSRLTCKTAGIYLLTACVCLTAAGAGGGYIFFRRDGVTAIGVATQSASIDGNTYYNLAVIYSLAVNDYVEVIASQNSGTTISTVVDSNAPAFSAGMVAYS